MQSITYTISKRLYNTLCYKLKTNKKRKIINYLNKTSGLLDKIADIKVK